MSTYVYGFTRRTHPLPITGMTGVGSTRQPLRLIDQDGLVAVVSDAPGNLRAKRRDLETHERVLETLCAVGTVLPMRFGIVAPDDSAVRAELASGADRYSGLLAKLDGHLELNVKAFHREDALLGALLLEHRSLRGRNARLRAAGGGTEQDKVAFGEQVAAAVETRRAEDAAAFAAILTPHASAIQLGVDRRLR